MEREGITIGLVHSNWAANKYEFVVHGEQAHTGSTVIAESQYDSSSHSTIGGVDNAMHGAVRGGHVAR